MSNTGKKVGFNREVATWKKYCCVCKRVREFLAHTYHREDIPLKELNLTFINDFEYSCARRRNAAQIPCGAT